MSTTSYLFRRPVWPAHLYAFAGQAPPAETPQTPTAVSLRRARRSSYLYFRQDRAEAPAYWIPSRATTFTEGEVIVQNALPGTRRRRRYLFRPDRGPNTAYEFPPVALALVNAPLVETAPVRGIHIATPRRSPLRAGAEAYTLRGVDPAYNPNIDSPPGRMEATVLFRSRRAGLAAYELPLLEAHRLQPITPPSARGHVTITARGPIRADSDAYILGTVPITAEIIPDVLDFPKGNFPQQARGAQRAAVEAYWNANRLATPQPIAPGGITQTYIPTERPRRRG